ncbi:MAG: pyruvate kinase [Candidatus Bathyarchaeota archaeon]|nr:pyruvate kinase [Candidatus Bathyarchaeota archaeon]
MKKTKIICTVGPASLSESVIKGMFEAGMNGVRINTAYGNITQFKSIIETVRKIAEIPIIVDIKGPEIRIRTSQRKVLCEGDVLDVGFECEELCFTHDVYDEMEVDDVVLIDNGKIRTHVVGKKDRRLQLRVLDGGVVEDGKGVNIPNKHLSVSTFTEKDLEIIEFAKEQGVEYVALSFVRNAQDVKNLSKIHGFEGGIIAKIENFEGVQNVKEILEVSDGLMVARGDLGVEIEPERVPLVQKSLIKLCNQKGKLVVTATEMLESMIHQAHPTRAEVSDVANAILDGSDAVMLSGETAVGEYPVHAVKMMTRIANQTEKAVKSNVEDTPFINISDTVSRAIQEICQNMPIAKVITLTRSGYTARVITRFKIAQPIIAVTPEIDVKKQLELAFGVQPVLMKYSVEKDRISAVANRLHSMGLVKDEETVLFTAGVRTTMEHASNSIEIHKIEELRKYASS